MVRLVRDIFHISGQIICDRLGHVVLIILNQAVPLVRELVAALQRHDDDDGDESMEAVPLVRELVAALQPLLWPARIAITLGRKYLINPRWACMHLQHRYSGVTRGINEMRPRAPIGGHRHRFVGEARAPSWRRPTILRYRRRDPAVLVDRKLSLAGRFNRAHLCSFAGKK